MTSRNNHSASSVRRQKDTSSTTDLNPSLHSTSGTSNGLLSVLMGFCLTLVVVMIVLIVKNGNLSSAGNSLKHKSEIDIGDGIKLDRSIFTIFNASVSSHFSSSPDSMLSLSRTKIPIASSFEKFLSTANLLQQRVEDSFLWIVQSKGINNEFPYLRWDLIANADVHILFKLRTFLKFYLENEDRQRRFFDLFHDSYQCKPLHSAQQELISKFISMDICSEIEWYKLAQLGWPEAKTIFDIGGNKGYLGSLFLSLWGGGKLNAFPIYLFNIANKLNSWKNSKNPAGYCKDGYNYGVSLYCPSASLRNRATGHCEVMNDGIRVYSFDGSSYLVNTVTRMVREHLFPLNGNNPSVDQDNLRKRSYWTYSHAAISSKEGVARFTKQSNEKNAGFEGGSIKWSSAAKETETKAASDLLSETEEVNVTTVDLYLERHQIKKLDILKIDTEGNDNKVLVGARRAIKDVLGMFTFEGGGGVAYSEEMNDEYDQFGYNCYSTSRAGLFKWNGRCMKEKYFGSFRRKDKGNIFCLHRGRAPISALAFEILSFPAMIDFYFTYLNSSSELNPKDQLLYQTLFPSEKNANQVGVQLNPKADPTALLPLYVNIRGFCSPWPECLANSA